MSPNLRTIFIGGGTPTLLPVECWQVFGAAMRGAFDVADGVEWTVETNPETFSRAMAHTLAALGVNRLSVGAQSFDPTLLAVLERQHDPANVSRTIDRAREYGIDNINIDLIFAIPGQSLTQWERDLAQAIALEPTHMSCYSLMYEPNTAMTQRLRSGAIERVDQAIEARMYEIAQSMLDGAGFEHYEISAWARPGARCAHNLLYWTNEDWWPLGPSASGHIDGVRWKNAPHLGRYLAAADGWPPVEQVERLDEDGRVGEVFMLQLRLMDGLTAEVVGQLLKRGTRGAQRLRAIEQHAAAGLLRWRDDRLQLTEQGMLLADDVLCDLV